MSEHEIVPGGASFLPGSAPPGATLNAELRRFERRVFELERALGVFREEVGDAMAKFSTTLALIASDDRSD